MSTISQRRRKDISHFIQTRRKDLNIQSNQDVMIAIVWVLPNEKTYFCLFPEVFFVDCVADTNSDKRPLLTLTGKDSKGKMFTILRMFLSNERAWIFRCIFSIVQPKIFSTSILSKVNVIISDGCKQEFFQIDAAIHEHFKNCIGVRCGFYIVTFGWKKHVLTKHALGLRKSDIFYDRVCDHRRIWIYSWMKASCSIQIEYLISTQIFFKFFRTKLLRLNLGYNSFTL